MSVRPVAMVVIAAALLGCASCAGATSGSAGAAPTTTATSSTDPALDANKVGGTVKSAAQAASAVHVKGALAEGGQPLRMDIQLNRDSAAGTVTLSGVTTPVVYVNKIYYIQFTADVLKSAGAAPNSAAGQKLLNKWIPSTSRLADANTVKEFSPLMDYQSFISGVFSQMDSTASVTATGRDTVDGVPVIVYKDASDGSTADVAAASPHYLMRVNIPSGNDAGSIDFTGWNQPVPVNAPPKSDIYSG